MTATVVITGLAIAAGILMVASFGRLLMAFSRNRITVARKALYWFKLWRTIIFIGLFINYLGTRFFRLDGLPPAYTGIGIVFIFLFVSVEDHLEEWVDDAEYDQILRGEAEHQLELGQSE